MEDITFDFNYGNPNAVNMDGIHLDGNCHYGVLRNLKGACCDDLIALNAHEGSKGPITNIEIDGIFAEDCHSAVRLLSVDEPVEKITISNVFGTYYQYAIGFTRHYRSESKKGYFDAITLDKIYASKAERYSVYCKDGGYVFPLIFIQSMATVKNLKISNFHRREEICPISTVFIGENVDVDSLVLDTVTTTNTTGEAMPLVENFGSVGEITLRNVTAEGDERLVDNGTIRRIRDED